jgi:hypothetical protein
VVTLELVAAADQNVVAAPHRDDNVVCDEPVSSLDKVENALRLSDATAPDEKEPDAKYISERSVKRRRRRELALENGFDAAVKLRRLQFGAQQRDA